MRPARPVNYLILKFKKNDYSMYVVVDVPREAVAVNTDPEAPLMPHPFEANAQNQTKAAQHVFQFVIH